jgi:hypothetical protein
MALHCIGFELLSLGWSHYEWPDHLLRFQQATRCNNDRDRGPGLCRPTWYDPSSSPVPVSFTPSWFPSWYRVHVWMSQTPPCLCLIATSASFFSSYSGLLLLPPVWFFCLRNSLWMSESSCALRRECEKSSAIVRLENILFLRFVWDLIYPVTSLGVSLHCLQRWASATSHRRSELKQQQRRGP